MDSTDHTLEGLTQPTQMARRIEGQRKLIFSHKGGKIIFLLAFLDALVTLIFASLPDTRGEESMIGSTIYRSRYGGIMLAQIVLAWISVLVSVAVVMLIWITFSVPADRLTFERKNNLWYVVVAKCLQVLFDVALLGYPTPMRQLFIFTAVFLRTAQIFYHLHQIRISREPFSRRIRPPLVIKALLDMKGDAIATAEPLTLGMLERLEGIVKVRDQLKFNVKHGRENLLFAVQMLLIFSLLSFFWEFAKVLTYQSRHFDRVQLDNIDRNSNLPMYWPSRAYDATANQPLSQWEYRPGSLVDCDGCCYTHAHTRARTHAHTNTHTHTHTQGSTARDVCTSGSAWGCTPSDATFATRRNATPTLSQRCTPHHTSHPSPGATSRARRATRGPSPCPTPTRASCRSSSEGCRRARSTRSSSRSGSDPSGRTTRSSSRCAWRCPATQCPTGWRWSPG